MVSFLGKPKNVFWEAFLLTIIVFVFGLFFGLALENSRVDQLNEYYVNSEIFLVDVLALNNVISSGNVSCSDLISSNIAFADRIYEESRMIDDYDEANKLGDNIQLVHKRYDLLRTLLWTSAIEAREECKKDFAIVVYLYERKTDDLAKKATQNVWSKILTDFKEKKGSEIILIPISVDSDLASLETMTGKYRIKSYPVVIINDQVINKLSSVEELESYLK